MSNTCTKEAWEIVREVFEEYRGLPGKLARLKSKSSETFSQHGREPRSINPDQTGSPSPASHFQKYCREFEAVERGAGRMLSQRICASLDEEFAVNDLLTVTQQDLHVNIIDENHDVQRFLARTDLETATRNEHLIFQRECDEAQEAIAQAKSRSVALMRQIEMSRRQVSEIQDERAARAR